MKKTQRLPLNSRWLLLIVLTFSLTGCATFDYWFGDGPQPSYLGGCRRGSGGGCRTPLTTTDAFQPVGYNSVMGPASPTGISARDMGFEKDSDHYRPIVDSRSSD